MTRSRDLLVSALVALAILTTIGTSPAFSQQAELVSANVAEVGKGYRASQLMGRKVLNDRDESIGTVSDFVIGRDYVTFAILEVGGFLGIGAHLVAIPIRALRFDESGHKMVLPGATREALKKFPEFKFQS
jgi:hypothetical protein